MNLPTILIYTLAGWSGFYVMAIELLGGRLLAPYFGSSIHVWGGLITVFMFSLSLGYLFGGYFSTRNPTLQRLCLLVLAAAVMSIPILFFADPLLAWVSDTVPDPRYGTLVSAMSLYFIPILLSGMVSPYAVRLLVTHYEHSGKYAGNLYFISTFGSAAGTIMTSFYFVLWFEVQTIMLGLLACSMFLSTFSLACDEKKHT